MFLITSDEGHILIDTGYASFLPLLQKNMEQLGFRFQDIKIVLLTHAHVDHCEGAARVKELTGAKLFVMEGDAEIVETGAGGSMPPAKVDRVLHDKTRFVWVATRSPPTLRQDIPRVAPLGCGPRRNPVGPTQSISWPHWASTMPGISLAPLHPIWWNNTSALTAS